MAAVARRAVDHRVALPVLAQSCRNDQPPQLAGAFKEMVVELSILEQALELARPRRIEMRTKPVDGDRQRRNAIRAETPGAKEAVFDFDQGHFCALQLDNGLRRRPRAPDGNRRPLRGAPSVAQETEWAGPVPQERCDMALFPK